MEPIPCSQDGSLLGNKLVNGGHPLDMEIAEKNETLKWLLSEAISMSIGLAA